MHSSCYETPTSHFRRLRLRRVSRTKVTLPDTSGLLPAFLLASPAMDSELGPISFLIAPRTLEADNSARTYRSRPLHPRHIVPSLRSSLHCGEIKERTVGSPNERRPGREAAGLLVLRESNGAEPRNCSACARLTRERAEN